MAQAVIQRLLFDPTSVWGLWCTEWHWDRFCSVFFDFLLSVLLPQCAILFLITTFIRRTSGRCQVTIGYKTTLALLFSLGQLHDLAALPLCKQLPFPTGSQNRPRPSACAGNRTQALRPQTILGLPTEPLFLFCVFREVNVLVINGIVS